MSNEFTVKEIGKIETSSEGFSLQLNEKYIPALTGLEGYSMIQVLWWANYVDTEEYRSMVTCQQPYKDAPDTMGIFATRSPARPNPICLTAVSVLNIDHENGTIIIPYIDAEDGSPILDIKPYHPSIDRVKNVSVPDWCNQWPQWLEDSASFDWDAVFVNAH
ncbi:MAG: SAM-dependent methyltransferase [Anaerolineaceae bacterium]|nr:SAM-dependent methyltransferase [Anaerolineaceae bacterium]